MQDLKKLMKQSQYVDQEIDNLIQTLVDSGVIQSQDLQGSKSKIKGYDKLTTEAKKFLKDIEFISSSMATRNDKLEFLESIAEMATALGVSLSVEKLMPAVLLLVVKNPISGEEGNVKNIVFRQTGALLEFFSTSELSAGYLGLTDSLIPLFEDFFCQELMNPIAD